jgi:DNA-binding NarL/FixJ family response regulator
LRPTRLFLVDDEGLVAHAIRRGLEFDPDVEIVGHATSGSDVQARVAETRPDVVLLDAGMPGADDLELLDQLRRRCPETKVVLLSAVEDAEVASEAIRRGASAILGKGIDPGDVAPVIRQVAEGRLVAGDLAEALGAMAGTAGAAGLTEREREILEHVAAGRSNKQIAWRLSLSERTIKYYLTHGTGSSGSEGAQRPPNTALPAKRGCAPQRSAITFSARRVGPWACDGRPFG